MDFVLIANYEIAIIGTYQIIYQKTKKKGKKSFVSQVSIRVLNNKQIYIICLSKLVFIWRIFFRYYHISMEKSHLLHVNDL